MSSYPIIILTSRIDSGTRIAPPIQGWVKGVPSPKYVN